MSLRRRRIDGKQEMSQVGTELWRRVVQERELDDFGRSVRMPGMHFVLPEGHLQDQQLCPLFGISSRLERGIYLQKPTSVRVDALGILGALFVVFGLFYQGFHTYSLGISLFSGRRQKNKDKRRCF